MRGRASAKPIGIAWLLWATGCLGDLGEGGGTLDGNGDTGTSAGDCARTHGWDREWAALEDEVLRLVNERRSTGANCGSAGTFGSAPALRMQSNLRCAARLHSMDMVERDFFSHENPDGESPWDRMEAAGYTNWRAVGENIAAGGSTAAGTMEQWMGSPGHCANIMSEEFTEIGVGYHPGGSRRHLWTQKFGRR